MPVNAEFTVYVPDAGFAARRDARRDRRHAPSRRSSPPRSTPKRGGARRPDASPARSPCLSSRCAHPSPVPHRPAAPTDAHRGTASSVSPASSEPASTETPQRCKKRRPRFRPAVGLRKRERHARGADARDPGRRSLGEDDAQLHASHPVSPQRLQHDGGRAPTRTRPAPAAPSTSARSARASFALLSSWALCSSTGCSSSTCRCALTADRPTAPWPRAWRTPGSGRARWVTGCPGLIGVCWRHPDEYDSRFCLHHGRGPGGMRSVRTGPEGRSSEQTGGSAHHPHLPRRAPAQAVQSCTRHLTATATCAVLMGLQNDGVKRGEWLEVDGIFTAGAW